jgi:hypothetical protein
VNFNESIPVAMRSKAWVCGRLLPGTAGSNLIGEGGDGCLLHMIVVLHAMWKTCRRFIYIVTATEVWRIFPRRRLRCNTRICSFLIM